MKTVAKSTDNLLLGKPPDSFHLDTHRSILPVASGVQWAEVAVAGTSIDANHEAMAGFHQPNAESATWPSCIPLFFTHAKVPTPLSAVSGQTPPIKALNYKDASP
jgi:hypothetical protein